MRINIVCVGSIKEKYFVQSINEYLKRLSRFHTIEIFEVEEEKVAKNYSQADIAKVQVKESLALNKFLKGYVILLDVHGESIDSNTFAENLQKIANTNSTITFIIGGSWGVSEAFKKLVNRRISFSSFTFPHQLMRVILLEQLYRATTICKNIPYAK